jgi:5-methylcytosine-specific restriction enzyme A
MSDQVNPTDPAAEDVVAGFLPDPVERRIALRQLVASADHARTVTPDAWSVTLYPHLFRLNVGKVEVLVVSQGSIQVNCVGRPGTAPLVGPHFRRPDYHYRSVHRPYCAYVGPIDQFARIEAKLQLPHREFIEVVGRTGSGEPVAGSPHTKSHSKDLMDYAWSVVAPAAWLASPDEVPAGIPLIEGAVCQVNVNAYERNQIARARCIAHYGPCCVVCGFNFGAVYGPLAEGFIHVHHIKPLSEIGEGYEVHPVADLRPVCPNCHAVIHLGGECRGIEEVRQLLGGGTTPNR